MNESKPPPPPSQELLVQTPPEVLAYFMFYMAQIESLTDRLLEAEAKIAELEQRLALTSQNSNRPPSSDPPSSKRPPGRPKKKRKPGGQPGHKGHKRELIPVEDVDDLIKSIPDACSSCGHSFEGIESLTPERHQVTELPPIEPLVIEYQLHHIDCPQCNAKNKAKRPQGMPPGMFGPRLVALVALLTGQYQLTKRLVVRLVQDFFSIRMGLGSVSRLEKLASDSLAQPVGEIAAAIKHQQRVHADETGMKQKKKKGWLWVFLTGSISLFILSASRGAKVVKDALGLDFSGTLYSDRWSAYNWLDDSQRQFCWAHLIRDFEQFKLRGDESARLGELLLDQIHYLFHLVHRVRDGTLSRAFFEKRAQKIRQEVDFRLRQGAKCASTKKKPGRCDCEREGKKCVAQKSARLCRKLLAHEESMWKFLEEEELELTNNAAERALRPAVIYRKRSFGVEGEGGCRSFERMMSAVTSLRLQNRHVFEYMAKAVEAHFQGELPPSLLPIDEPYDTDSP